MALDSRSQDQGVMGQASLEELGCFLEQDTFFLLSAGSMQKDLSQHSTGLKNSLGRKESKRQTKKRSKYVFMELCLK